MCFPASCIMQCAANSSGVQRRWVSVVWSEVAMPLGGVTLTDDQKPPPPHSHASPSLHARKHPSTSSPTASTPATQAPSQAKSSVLYEFQQQLKTRQLSVPLLPLSGPYNLHSSNTPFQACISCNCIPAWAEASLAASRRPISSVIRFRAQAATMWTRTAFLVSTYFY